MEAGFWYQKWANNQIGFHVPEANPLLTKHFATLDQKSGSRVFIPLCGKTLDIDWFLSQGYSVVGIELSTLAVEQLFEQLRLKPEISLVDNNLTLYSASNIAIFVGDIFALQAVQVGHVDLVYDRAALVALPDAMRILYAAQLVQLAPLADQLLVCFEYDQSIIAGPPFSICSAMVREYYEAHYTVHHLDTVDVIGGLKGLVDATESVWHLKRLAL